MVSVLKFMKLHQRQQLILATGNERQGTRSTSSSKAAQNEYRDRGLIHFSSKLLGSTFSTA